MKEDIGVPPFGTISPCNAHPLLDRKRQIWRFHAVMRRQLERRAAMAAGKASTAPTQDIARLGFVMARPDLQRKLVLYNGGGSFSNPVVSAPAMACGTVSLTHMTRSQTGARR